ncbi:superoxide dismutase [Ni], partial [Nocardioides zeae]
MLVPDQRHRPARIRSLDLDLARGSSLGPSCLAPRPPTERNAVPLRLFAPSVDVEAHCDLPCGVYDPAQA